MYKSVHSFLYASILAGAFAITANAQTATTDAKTKPADTNAKSEKPAADTNAKSEKAQGEKPKESPGWVIVEEDWWFPLRFDFSESLHQARMHYRAHQEKAAASEIEKATTWLTYAIGHADKSTNSDLLTARADLRDFAATLNRGGQVNAKNLDAAFAHALIALAKHHHFKSNKALAKGDLKHAGHELMMAADHLRNAARSANYEYGDDVVEIFDNYSPHGYWDEEVVFEPNKLKSNLMTIEQELVKIAKKLDAAK